MQDMYEFFDFMNKAFFVDSMLQIRQNRKNAEIAYYF